MLVSFIIPALNEERHLPACLRSIAALDKPATVSEIEVIVVDNGSQDATTSVARQYGALVMVSEPGRIGRTRNIGARQARGDVLAFIDADCELSANWLTRCVEHLQDAQIVAVGTRMAPPAEHSSWVENSWFAMAHQSPDADVEPVDWLPSFNMLVRRSEFDQIGGFDERLVTCEDSDLGYRLGARGRLVRDHVATTRHHGESKTLKVFFRREAWRGRDSARSLFSGKIILSELPSVLVPPAFLSLLILGTVLLALAAAGAIALWPAWVGNVLAWGGAACLVVAALLPAAALLKKRISPLQPLLFLQCWTLLGVYFCARAVGLVFPMRRLDR
ncbi:MAG: glycosyltransferase [Planctomycetes bacterium]|nr:glycosyltransferase [Planctomycetota bacterium]